MKPWNWKYGKKSNYRTVLVEEWENYACSKEIHFLAEIEGKVIRLTVPYKTMKTVYKSMTQEK